MLERLVGVDAGGGGAPRRAGVDRGAWGEGGWLVGCWRHGGQPGERLKMGLDIPRFPLETVGFAMVQSGCGLAWASLRVLLGWLGFQGNGRVQTVNRYRGLEFLIAGDFFLLSLGRLVGFLWPRLQGGKSSSTPQALVRAANEVAWAGARPWRCRGAPCSGLVVSRLQATTHDGFLNSSSFPCPSCQFPVSVPTSKRPMSTACRRCSSAVCPGCASFCDCHKDMYSLRVSTSLAP